MKKLAGTLLAYRAEEALKVAVDGKQLTELHC